MALLEVRRLQTQFTTRAGIAKAVDGATFSIDAGETLALVGESGCGKSVTAFSMLRLVADPPGRIIGGEILFDGRDLLQLSDAEMRGVRGDRIAMIFQEPMTSLNPVHTVGAQIAEAFRLSKGLTGAEADKATLDVLERVRIPDARSRLGYYPHQLSGGMRQRILIAIAFACEPKLVIADEPTTALDVTVQKQILRLIRELQAAQGTALLFVTHDLGVVAKLCEHVVVMHGGRVLESAPAESLFAHPAHEYTRALLAATPRFDRPGDALRPVPPELAARLEAEVRRLDGDALEAVA
ncbi:MAG: ABC transporter ATP-binding protein [Burkholderiales bacterium]|nr:ABC transporter ATP-binding protein [Burkholderiales bacterium]